MRMLLGVTGMVALLSGCGVDDWINRMKVERFQNACAGFGFTPNTTPFANCMMQQSAQDQEESQRVQDRAAFNGAAEKLRKRK